jgi:hypothetical protein
MFKATIKNNLSWAWWCTAVIPALRSESETTVTKSEMER